MRHRTNAAAVVVTDFRLTTGEAAKRIHKLAIRTENVIFGDHALERMDERSITDAQVFEVLRKGHVVDPPEKTTFGEWKCKIIEQLRGGRAVGAVTVFLQNGKLFLKTVEWEDQK
jgi:hypothetical protein